MSPRSDTPQRLLAEAMRVIDEHGEAAVHIRDIAAACGVTSPIVYKAYGSREGLIVAAQTERYISSWRETAHDVPEAILAANTVDELKAVIAGAIRAILGPERHIHRRTRHEILGSLVHHEALEKAVVEQLALMRDRFGNAFEAARQKGLVRPDLDGATAFMWYIGQIEGRFLIELDMAGVDETTWNRIFLEAVFFSLFEDPSVPAPT